jgi:hypothetical protein
MNRANLETQRSIGSMTMNKTVNTDIRALNDSEIDLVVGGVIDGCIRMPTITPFNPLPPSTPWFDPKWVLVGKTGTLPA